MYMGIKSLMYFEGLNTFLAYSSFLDDLHWKIEKQLLKDRVLKYKNMEQYICLKKLFIDNKLSIWELKEEEIITWFDTMIIMKNMIFNMIKKGINNQSISIIMEYPIINGNHMRTDYLIVYDRLIVVLEFGMFNQDEKRSEERYTKKLQESINYRQIIANQVDKEISVVNYTMIYRPEYDSLKGTILHEHVEYNNHEIALLSDFICNCLQKQDNLKAIFQLNQLK